MGAPTCKDLVSGRTRLWLVVDQPGPERDAVAAASERARLGGAPKYHDKLAEHGKLFVRERLRLFLDDADEFAEDGLLTNALEIGRASCRERVCSVV